MAGNLRDNRNELIRLFNAAIAEAPAVIGIAGPFATVLTMTDGDGVPENNKDRKPWARYTIQHTSSERVSIGGRRYQNNGRVTVQCFVDRSATSADNKAQLFAAHIANRMRGHVGSVSLTGVTVQERPIDNNFASMNVAAGFYWTELLARGN